MSRIRTDAVKLRPTNNAFTALAGVACVAVLVALILLYLKWQDISDGPLFFGLF